MTLGGCGIDVVDVRRIDRLLRRHGEAFINRWFARSEIAFCADAQKPAIRFAACLAAKEAAMKVLHLDSRGRIPWGQIEIGGWLTTPAHVRLWGEPAEAAARLGIGRIFVSVSSDDRIATAVAFGEICESRGSS